VLVFRRYKRGTYVLGFFVVIKNTILSKLGEELPYNKN
jgi:hypothetical protein